MSEDSVRRSITRRQMLWAPPAAVGAALLADAPAYGTERTIARICRSSWGAKPATGAFVSHQISRITVHHSAVVLRDNRKAPAQLRSFQADHQARGWPDIAYHMLIDRRGNLYLGRPLSAVGDTNTSYDPTGHLLVLALGNFQEQEIASAQLNMTVNVLAWACSRYGIEPSTIRGHRAYANTLCPGDKFQRYITDGTVERRVAGRLGTVTLKNLCGAAGKRRVRQIVNGTH
jgi:N-acetylmuramoyl-L-alanine amidase